MALTKFNYNSFDVTSAASTALGFNANANGFATINPGSMTLIKTLTASSSSTLSFVDGSSSVVLDNTYPVYMFKFINIHPQNNNVDFEFNLSTDSGSNYNVTKTTTLFKPYHDEADSSTTLSYDDGRDIAQGTGYQDIATNLRSSSAVTHTIRCKTLNARVLTGKVLRSFLTFLSSLVSCGRLTSDAPPQPQQRTACIA